MYARLVATLDPCSPDLAPELVQQLKGEFRFRVSIQRLSSPSPKYIKIAEILLVLEFLFKWVLFLSVG